jgi:CBS domain containing-hemolysin-like protein
MTLVWLLAIAGLVALNGFFVAAELALATVRRTELEEAARQGRSGAPAAREAVEHIDRVIAATQLGITIASISLGSLGESTLSELFTPVVVLALGENHLGVVHGISIAVALALITFLHVVLGELAPKSIAIQRPLPVALLLARPLLLFGRVFRPAIRVLNFAGDLVIRGVGLEPVPGHARAHSVEELRMLVDETQQAGLLRPGEAYVLRNVFRLRSKTVADILVPLDRADQIDLRWKPDRILDAVREGAHTRMPVFSGDPSNVVGIVNTKSLFHLYSLAGIVNVYDVMKEPTFVPPEMRIEDLLREFRRHRRHLAVVRPEGGRPIGIVTLEDILEEIVGEIEDEHDPAPARVE